MLTLSKGDQRIFFLFLTSFISLSLSLPFVLLLFLLYFLNSFHPPSQSLTQREFNNLNPRIVVFGLEWWVYHHPITKEWKKWARNKTQSINSPSSSLSFFSFKWMRKFSLSISLVIFLYFSQLLLFSLPLYLFESRKWNGRNGTSHTHSMAIFESLRSFFPFIFFQFEFPFLSSSCFSLLFFVSLFLPFSFSLIQ